MQEKQDGAKVPQNTVSLLTAAVKSDGSQGQPFTFTVVSPTQKTYQLQAENEADMREWMSAIQVAAPFRLCCDCPAFAWPVPALLCCHEAARTFASSYGCEHASLLQAKTAAHLVQTATSSL